MNITYLYIFLLVLKCLNARQAKNSRQPAGLMLSLVRFYYAFSDQLMLCINYQKTAANENNNYSYLIFY